MYINDVKASECDDSGRKVAGDIVRWIACNWAHVTHNQISAAQRLHKSHDLC